MRRTNELEGRAGGSEFEWEMLFNLQKDYNMVDI